MSNLTIVTGLFDLGRDKLDGFGRPWSHYTEAFEKFLRATSHLPLLVYIEPHNEQLVWAVRDIANTKVVLKTLDDLREFPFYSKVQEIRKNPHWYGQSGWMPDSPQAALELYNPMVMSKQFLLNDASIMNFFNTKYFLWLDAGLNNTVNLQDHLTAEFEARIVQHMNKMLYVCFPYDGTVEVHGYPKDKMDSMSGTKTEYVARGGIFGGTRDAISQVNDAYYRILDESMNNNWMGTEESLFTILSYKHPQLCNVRMIEGNGLVVKFFDDMKNGTVAGAGNGKVALYTLTFNIPKQFQMFIDSFKNAYPNEFAEMNKYVVNNSTDPKVDKEYKRIFAANGFEEFKFDNIGINDGRHFCAEHFDKSEDEFMIFFEDDMLLHDDPNMRCKNGFTTYHVGLIDKAVEIVKNEALDYLKLSFSEFYGDNHDNWAWENVRPEARKLELFPARDDGVSPKKARIDYTGTHRGLPFAVGEYHYCNWPIIFTKKGNRVIFLENVYEHKYEQTWMSLAMDPIREKRIKVGTLLASPINHYRKYHYGHNTRKENKHA